MTAATDFGPAALLETWVRSGPENACDGCGRRWAA
jgi:hypothetical protein